MEEIIPSSAHQPAAGFSDGGPHTELDKLPRPMGNIKLQHAFRLLTIATQLIKGTGLVIALEELTYFRPSIETPAASHCGD